MFVKHIFWFLLEWRDDKTRTEGNQYIFQATVRVGTHGQEAATEVLQPKAGRYIHLSKDKLHLLHQVNKESWEPWNIMLVGSLEIDQ